MGWKASSCKGVCSKLQTRWCTQSSCNYCKRLASLKRNLTVCTGTTGKILNSPTYKNRKSFERRDWTKNAAEGVPPSKTTREVLPSSATKGHRIYDSCRRGPNCSWSRQENTAALSTQWWFCSEANFKSEETSRLTAEVRKLLSLAAFPLLPNQTQWEQLPATLLPQLLLPHLPTVAHYILYWEPKWTLPS